MTKPSIRAVYEKRVKAIKRFVTFNVRDRTIKAKSLRDKVRRYYNLIYGSEGQPGLYNPATDVPIRPRGKAFAAIRDSEGQPAHRGIRVVFVETIEDPVNPGKLQKPVFVIKGGKVSKNTSDVIQTFYPFRVRVSRNRDLEDAFTADCRRIFALAPTVRKWVIKCGKRQTENALTRDAVVAKVISMLNRYADTVANWLAGLVAIEFESTASIHSFLAEREKLRKGKSGRKARRRNRR